MKRLPLLFITMIFVACASAGPDVARQRGGRGFTGENTRPMRADDAAAPAFVPPFNWWHNDNLANAISLTADQVRALDAAVGGDAGGFARLEGDLRNAAQDFRSALEADPIVADKVTAAAQRVRDARSTLFERQVELLLAERRIVTAQQWKDLEQMFQRSRRGDGDSRGRRGNRGGYPGNYPGGMPGGGPPNPWGW